MLTQRLFCGRSPQDDGRVHVLAERPVRHGERHGLRNGRVAKQGVVDVHRCDLLPAAVDPLGDASGDGQVAVGVHRPVVPRAEPPANEGGLVRFAVVLVAVHHVQAPHDHLARCARRQQRARLIHDRHLHAEAEADRAGLADPRRQGVAGHLVGGLGHPVRLGHRRTEDRFHAVFHHGRQRRAAGPDEAERVVPEDPGVAVGAREQHLMHRRHGRVPGGPERIDPSPEPESVESGRAYHRTAAGERRQQRGHDPVNVEQRHHAQGPVFRREGTGVDDIGGRGSQVSVPDRNALRMPSGAAGVQQDRHVVRTGGLHRAWGTHGAGRLEAQFAGLAGHGVNHYRPGRGRGVGVRDGAGRRDQSLYVPVLVVEGELLGPVLRVEGDGGAAYGCRQEG